MAPIVQRPKALTKILVQDPSDSASVADALHRMQDQLLAQLNPTLKNPVVGGTSFTSPLTTKGDLYGRSTADARVPVGVDATVLTADSTQALGVKWAAAAAGGSAPWTLATKPAVADARDEEFDGASTVGSTWTDVAGTSLVVTNPITPATAVAAGKCNYNWNAQRPGWIMMQPKADANPYGIKKTVAFGANELIYTRFTTDNPGNAPNALIGYYILQCTDGGAHQFFVRINTAAGQIDFGGDVSGNTTGILVSGSATPTGYTARPLLLEGFGLLTNGTSCDIYVFTSNGGAAKVGTATSAVNASTFTTLILSVLNAATGPQARVCVDFLRFRADGSLP